ncbi:MAG: AAA family ATPase [Phycisphaeraceae bacterium]|nr:AAA family ATPase [Phycisphaeraceae bacterium]
METNDPAALERQALNLERRALVDLIAGSEARSTRLAEIAAQRQRDLQVNDTTHAERMAAIQETFSRSTHGAKSARDRTIAEAEATFAAEMMKLARKRETVVQKARTMADEARTAAQRQHDEAIWLAESIYEGAEGTPRTDYERTREEISTRRGELQGVADQALVLIRRYRQRVPARVPPTEAQRESAIRNSSMAMTTALAVAQNQLTVLRGLPIPKLFRGPILLVPWMILVGATVGAVGAWRGFTDGVALVGAGLGATLLFVAVIALLWVVARRQVRNAWAPVAESMATFSAAADFALEQASNERAERERQLVETRDREIARAQAALAPRLAEIQATEADALRQIEEQIPARRHRIADTRDREVTAARLKYEQESADATALRDRENATEMARVASRRAEIDARADRDEQETVAAWRALQERTLEVSQALATADHARSPGWSDPSWTQWTPPRTFAPVARLGALKVDLAAIPHALPEQPELAWPLDGRPPRFDWPVTLTIPERASMLIECDAPGRDQAIATLQATMMRLLTGLPPGKVQLVVVDPVGLGQSFAGFMHLADSSAKLVGDRIWTEPRHIEQKLIDLTEHMETVIQKYLRDEFPTIRDYNEQAGELAEPYRFLVVADYPASFTEPAAARLNSIVSSGARCGVFTLIMRDLRRELPPTADPVLLRRDALRLEWREDRFRLMEPELEALPLSLDPAPPPELVIPTMRRVGEAAVDAGRVEVPFSVIAPKPERLWSESCAATLRVPLGRTGATKLQSLILGEGTKQHVLIAGKTGSGKSTLLHALITNTALWFGPDEVEMYLIDFKKGVEFKTYAEHALPHARAIAIESDREFGLSVLQGLDGELKRRGDLFRDLGLQDLRGYRALGRPEPMPRILLIVDEFQELFIDDDKVAQEASLLLDRLVRQGRAFGMHVILGSQTLGGAYSLPRTTMGQMAVRIALQCNEADAQLILSDDNTAARLLGRPGEAIYNDAGGLVQGNSPFQIVWLNDSERDAWLDRCTQAIRQRADGRPTPPPPIVFEGNVPANLAANPLLRRALDGTGWCPAPTGAAPSAWLGEAISIKDPTSLLFRRQSGANAVVVGQQDDAASAVMISSLISLAAQMAPARSRFIIMDGLPADGPFAGGLERVARELPHPIEIVPYREVDQAIRRIGEEVAQRTVADDGEPAALFVMIHALHRFRSLRRSDDDYGFGGGDAAPTTASLLASILRDGPTVGVHTITWVDTLASLQRSLDRGGLREFDQRVLFQLSSTDSSTLIDSPAATRLGANRALLYSEEQGTLEKFRPYRMPGEEWLRSFTDRLRQWASAPSTPQGTAARRSP